MDAAEQINELTQMLRDAGPTLLRGNTIPDEEDQDESSGDSSERRPSLLMKTKSLDLFKEKMEKTLKDALFLSKSTNLEKENNNSTETGGDSSSKGKNSEEHWTDGEGKSTPEK